MRHLLTSLLMTGLLSLLSVAVYAQETFAPLLSDNTVFVAHIDYGDIELDALKEGLAAQGEAFLDGLGFDALSKRQTLAELRTELSKIEAVLAPLYATLTDTIGITEIALISDMELVAQGVPLVLVLPWKDDTETKRLAFESWAEEARVFFDLSGVVNTVMLAGDWLLVTMSTGRGSDETELLNEWVETVIPNPESRICQALKACGDAEVKIAAAIPEAVRTMLTQMPVTDEIPREFRGLILFAAQKIEWANMALPICRLLNSDAETSQTFLTVKMAKPADARQMRSLLAGAIEWGVNMAQVAMTREQNTEFSFPPLAFAFMKGYLRTFLPEAEGDTLVFRASNAPAGGMMAVGGVGVALLLPAVQAAREAGRRMQCTNNIKMVMIALHNYHDTHNALPPLYTVDATGKPLHSWRVLILPYIEEVALYSNIRFNEPWDSEYNRQFHAMTPAIFRCPNHPNAASPDSACCYAAIAGEVFVPAKKAGTKTGLNFSAVRDGTSNTVAVVEVSEPFCWMDPTADVTLDDFAEGIDIGRVGSFHSGGCNIGLFDGAVRFLPNTVDRATLRALGTRDGGEVMNLP